MAAAVHNMYTRKFVLLHADKKNMKYSRKNENWSQLKYEKQPFDGDSKIKPEQEQTDDFCLENYLFA